MCLVGSKLMILAVSILTRNALNLLLQNLLMCILIKRILEALHEDPDECVHICVVHYI